MDINQIKTGLRVRLNQHGIDELCGPCGLTGPHKGELIDDSNNCLKCSREHVLEFKNSKGTVVGPWQPNDPDFWDVMWDKQLRYAYKPEYLDFIE